MHEAIKDCMQQLLETARSILDVGSGERAAFWYAYVPESARVVAVDRWFRTRDLPGKTEFHPLDIVSFCRADENRASFDLAVAHHLFEHLLAPDQVCAGLNRVLSPGGVLSVAVPDCNQFSDRFYRAFHLDGGGHCAAFTLETLTELVERFGFERTEHLPWEESWTWLDHGFDLARQSRKHVDGRDLKHLADTLRRELTFEKGFFYGWSVTFRKVQDLDDYSLLFREEPEREPNENEKTLNERFKAFSDWASTQSERLRERDETILRMQQELGEKQKRLMEISDWAQGIQEELKMIHASKWLSALVALKKGRLLKALMRKK